MLKVGTVLKYISQISHPSAAQSTFAQYLTNFYSFEELLSPETIQCFINDCLDYPHWQQNKNSFSREIQDLVIKLADVHGVEFAVDTVKWPEQMQVLEIESLEDWIDIINKYLSFQYKKGEKYRIVSDPDNQRILAIVLNPQGQIIVRSFNKKCTIRNGHIEPLRTDLALKYDRNLELLPQVTQKIDTGPYMTARFVLEGKSVFGTQVRGYLAQRFQEMQGESLERFGKLFYSIKRLEQFFIKRESDPFYQELLSTIESSIQLIRVGDASALSEAPDLLMRAQNALDYVFVGDKLLTLLVRDLQYTMAGSPKPTPVSINPIEKEHRVKSQVVKSPAFEDIQVTELTTTEDDDLWAETMLPIRNNRRYDLTN